MSAWEYLATLVAARQLQILLSGFQVQCALDVDGSRHGSVVQAGHPQPFMFLLRSATAIFVHPESFDPADIHPFYDRLPRWRLRSRSCRQTISHLQLHGALLKSCLSCGGVRGLGGSYRGRRQLPSRLLCSHSFSTRTCKGAGAFAAQDFICSAYTPEIHILEGSTSRRAYLCPITGHSEIAGINRHV